MKKLTCSETDKLLGDYTGWHVESTLTDPHGHFGDPRIETTWGRGNQRVQSIRDPHYGQYAPGPDGDREPCEHYYWEEKEHHD